jgi:hypothetical protein
MPFACPDPQVLTQVEQVHVIGEAIGRRCVSTEPMLVRTTVKEITGTPARTFREWAVDHADDFR